MKSVGVIPGLYHGRKEEWKTCLKEIGMSDKSVFWNLSLFLSGGQSDLVW